jgi:hypothetical protein
MSLHARCWRSVVGALTVQHRAPLVAQDAAPTFAQQVAPILYANCTTCHRPGGLGPFSLLEYENARKAPAPPVHPRRWEPGTIEYQYFELPTGFTEDKWVNAIEVMPGDRRVVHHVLAYARPPAAPAAAAPAQAAAPRPAGTPAPNPRQGRKRRRCAISASISSISRGTTLIRSRLFGPMM